VEDWKTQPWPLKNDTQFRTFSCNNSATWYNLILTPPSLENWGDLAVEVIATHLNILSGTMATDELQEALNRAEKLLQNCTWSEDETEESTDLLSTLRGYNQERISRMMSGNTNDAEKEETEDEQQYYPQLLLLALIPAILLVIAIIVVGILVFKKKMDEKNTVTTA
jgi:uncharacterized membrane protein YidH (DUF202 family)